MSNRIESLQKEILEKKFKKRIHAGYDPLDVDEFFDKVISYLSELNNHANDIFKQYKDAQTEIQNLKQELAKKEEFIKVLNEEINDYKKNGYTSVRINSKLNSLKEMIEKSNNKKD